MDSRSGVLGLAVASQIAAEGHGSASVCTIQGKSCHTCDLEEPPLYAG